MGPPRLHPVRETDLGCAVRSIRRRLGLGQIGLVLVLTGRPHAGEISRYESGQTCPNLKTLLALLRLAETPEEREPILGALRRQGIETLLSNLHACGLAVPINHETSIHPTQSDRNIDPEVITKATPTFGPGVAMPGGPA
jgi:hypothetical protein